MGRMLEIKSWCNELEESALEQAKNLAKHPKAFRHIALMPDCHTGMGMPIGGVLACDNAVIPNAVGVDIGCGMVAVQTTLQDISKDDIKKIIGELREEIPVGFKHQEYNMAWDGFDKAPDIPIIQQQIGSARKQLGTLGGGNHFIEIQKGSDGNIWLMLHSGSRNVGYKIANYYNKEAEKLCKMWGVNNNDSLCFLPIGTKEAQEYIASMNFALKFAMQNRKLMMGVFKDILISATGAHILDEINIHHNFAQVENHFEKNVWVHRKGATQAKVGQKGIIPGSMGTKSYIVEGLGNRDSFESCSHGAGRNMSRTQFNNTHTLEECDKAMEGIIFGRWGLNRKKQPDLSEAPQAYKDIDTVMASQKDLVKILVELKPLGVMKG